MGTKRVRTSTGVELAFDDAGRPDRPTMVLLHALGESRSSWSRIAAELTREFRVLSFDLRGHGDSDWPGQYSFQLMCDDIVDALGQLGQRRVTLVGHSMGGVVCYLIAVACPETVERLIVEDVPPPYERDRPLPVRDDEAVGFDWDVVPAIVGQVNAGDPATWSRLASITAPTLLIGGGPDSHIPQATLEDVAGRIPRCKHITIPAGHHVHESRPEEFTQALMDWALQEDEGQNG